MGGNKLLAQMAYWVIFLQDRTVSRNVLQVFNHKMKHWTKKNDDMMMVLDQKSLDHQLL